MQQIQRVALDLFDERGYAAVTIADIAAAAEVGERSVYRYFGTKQDVLLYDEIDELVIAGLAANLRRAPVLEAVRLSIDDTAAMFTPEVMGDALRKLRLLDSNRELQAAFTGYLDQIGDQIGQTIATHRHLPDDDPTARIQGRCIVAALAVALDRWFRSGGTASALTELHRALDVLAAGFDDMPTTDGGPPASGP